MRRKSIGCPCHFQVCSSFMCLSICRPFWVCLWTSHWLSLWTGIASLSSPWKFLAIGWLRFSHDYRVDDISICAVTQIMSSTWCLVLYNLYSLVISHFDQSHVPVDWIPWRLHLSTLVQQSRWVSCDPSVYEVGRSNWYWFLQKQQKGKDKRVCWGNKSSFIWRDSNDIFTWQVSFNETSEWMKDSCSAEGHESEGMKGEK